MTSFSDSTAVRLLHRLAGAVCQRPQWFVYPQICLSSAGAFCTVLSLEEAVVRSGCRRWRPVLMTLLAAALGMLPLAWGVVGSGADMLRHLAIAVIGALCISVLLSLVATPTV
jgi:Cu/Ag efflux pump CusA